MPDAGMTVYNGNNKIQIDGSYKNLYLSRKITLSGAGVTSGSFASGEVIAAVGGTGAQTIDAYCVNSPTGWTCTVKSFSAGMCVYVFSTKVTASAHGAGLQVFNGSGDIVYDSNNKHPLVVGFGQSDSNSVATAIRPAIAVCNHQRIAYTDKKEWIEYKYEPKQESVFHPAEYGYKTVTKYNVPVYHPAEYGYYWTTGYYDYQWVNGQYQAVWVGPQYVYGLIKEAYTSYETVTTTEYGIVKDAYTETVTNWYFYRYTYEVLYTKWKESNFKLSAGKIVTAEVNSGTTGEGSVRLIEKYQTTGSSDPWERYTSGYKYKSVVVDTRSWLLFDVKDL
ncbi:hypothetical protein SAMN04487864_11529 [Succiniclasticum ruminis]|uniref:Uncharacterized protein n=1 Tax=Succiniclasticum ruminis TaxID=40841 RepID=A0A1G6NPN6_9FIRM|nr:hypothetical protein [Succiniclasticum ruminis]SDC69621.1 hypothetical protein SAMN04487864_11529 [Succiniclasticum ruminis]